MNGFSQTLKTWRTHRRFSQLDLALEAEVSSRHISFLETGRARPSADMISRLGAALQLPLEAQNRMLTQAGFAARFSERNWDEAEMAPIKAAVDHLLESHAPYPGMALDRLWNITALNRPAEVIFGMLGVAQGHSLLDLMMSEKLPPLIENWQEVAWHVAQRLRTESAAAGGIDTFDQAAERLSAQAQEGSNPLGPVVPTIFDTGTIRLSMFSTLAQFGTPEDVTLDGLKIELYFPTDEATKKVLEGLGV